MICDNKPVHEVPPEKVEARCAEHLRFAQQQGYTLSPELAEWMRQQDLSLDPANALNYPAA